MGVSWYGIVLMKKEKEMDNFYNDKNMNKIVKVIYVISIFLIIAVLSFIYKTNEDNKAIKLRNYSVPQL